jgi:hypothetical protein
MSRFLPVLFLFLVSAAASANQAPASDEPATKPGKASVVATSQDSEAAPSVHVATPNHGSAQRTPRWHSLLPGMIR